MYPRSFCSLLSTWHMSLPFKRTKFQNDLMLQTKQSILYISCKLLSHCPITLFPFILKLLKMKSLLTSFFHNPNPIYQQVPYWYMFKIKPFLINADSGKSPFSNKTRISQGVFRDRVSCIPGWPQTHYVSRDSPELLILLPPSPTQLCAVLGTRVSSVLSRHSTLAISPSSSGFLRALSRFHQWTQQLANLKVTHQ